MMQLPVYKCPKNCGNHYRQVSPRVFVLLVLYFTILHTQIDITAPRLLQVHFINGSPVVEGNTVRVDIMATVPGASFMCELLRKNSSSMMADCEWWWLSDLWDDSKWCTKYVCILDLTFHTSVRRFEWYYYIYWSCLGSVQTENCCISPQLNPVSYQKESGDSPWLQLLHN